MNLRTPPGPLLVAHDYMHLLLRLRVRVRPESVLLLIECTRCGGNHPLSQRKWPLINK